MGIDVYMRWDAIPEEQIKAQYKSIFSIDQGRHGYLREAYHGGPYVTHYLVAEAFASGDGTAQIMAKVLRERLPKAINIARERSRTVYNEEADDDTLEAFADFVALAEKVEAATGKPVTIIASY